jgi:hypothetical protein
MVDAIEKERDERRASRNRGEMMEAQISNLASELVAYHKLKRRFLNLKDIAKEDPNQLMMCEFNGQDFQFLMD